MRAEAKPVQRAMYVANQLDEGWLLDVQRKLYARSWNEPVYVWCKLWGLVTDRRNLTLALARVSRNRGARTAGVDGLTVRRVLQRGADDFVERLRVELRSGQYRPSPVRRVLIPKTGQPGKFRPLGIPTVKDRVVQAAVKNILEPIFEADFWPVSYGFRPGKSAHEALEQLLQLVRPRAAGPERRRRLSYQWAIEGDIKGCFDNIDHHALMQRLCRRIGDNKVCRLVRAFLKAGVMSEAQFTRSDAGTPQGGILSPLLSNIALSVIEERYERHVWPRHTPTSLTDARAVEKRALRMRAEDRNRRPVLYPIRYADDFIILVGVPAGERQYERARDLAHAEKARLAADLKERLHLELSDAKTLVTPVTTTMRFLGHHVRVREHPTSGRLVSTAVIPKDPPARAHQGNLRTPDDAAHAGQSPALAQSAAARLVQLLPPRVGREARLRGHRPLRVVDHLPMAQEEAPSRIDATARRPLRLATTRAPRAALARRIRRALPARLHARASIRARNHASSRLRVIDGKPGA